MSKHHKTKILKKKTDISKHQIFKMSKKTIINETQQHINHIKNRYQTKNGIVQTTFTIFNNK